MCLPTKERVSHHLGAWHAYIERHFLPEDLPTHFWSNGGGEFMNGEVKSYCSSTGLKHLHACRHTPEHNAFVERLNGIVGVMMESARIGAGKPAPFWEFALEYAHYVLDLLPSKGLPNGMSPFQNRTGIVPTIDHLRVWGCDAVVYIPKAIRAKGKALDVQGRHGTPMVFVGIDPDTIDGYRFYNPVTHRVITERTAVFFERHFTLSPAVPRTTLDTLVSAFIHNTQPSAVYTAGSAADVDASEHRADADDNSDVDGGDDGDHDGGNDDDNDGSNGADDGDHDGGNDYDNDASEHGADADDNSDVDGGDDGDHNGGNDDDNDGSNGADNNAPRRSSRVRSAPARLEHEQVEQAFATNCLFTYDRSSSSPCQSLPSSGWYDEDGDFADAFIDLDHTTTDDTDNSDANQTANADDQCSTDSSPSSPPHRRPPRSSTSSPALAKFHTSMLRNHDPWYYASRISCPSLSRRHFRGHIGAEDEFQANVTEELRDILSDHISSDAAPCPITTADILKSISKDLLHTLGLPIPGTMAEALAHPTAGPFWREAIHKEFRGCIARGTWRLEPLPRGRRRIRCKWIFDLKPSKFKARLVAMGFSQRFGEDYSATFSPVANSDSVRALIALAAHRSLALHHIDVSQAFLYGDLDEELFMQQPEGFIDPEHPRYACRLLKSLYGLKQAGRVWNQLLVSTLTSIGYTPLKSDPCTFIRLGDDGAYSILVCHVDDILAAYNSTSLLDELRAGLAGFDTTEVSQPTTFVGFEIQYFDDGSIGLHNRDYIHRLLESFKYTGCKPYSTPMQANVRFGPLDCPSTPAETDDMPCSLSVSPWCSSMVGKHDSSRHCTRM